MALLSPGTVLSNRYEVLGVLGEGGMGAVYRVADLRLNRKAWAVKAVTLKAEVNLRQEADLLATLENEHLPRIVDYFEVDPDGYLVMELVEGETLEKRVRDHGPLSVEKLATQLCETLEYLHQHQPPVVFRDLKPANVMITPKGDVKLIDFGIARLFDETRTQDTVALGTPGYAAPEQYGKAQSDVRVDIYGLGATLYFAVSGLDPADQSFPLKALKTAFPKSDAALSDILEKCTAVDPDARYGSAREVRLMIAGLSASPPLPAPKTAPHQAPPTRQLRRWFARKPAAPPPPLLVSPVRLDFGHVYRNTTQQIPLSISGPKVKVKSDTRWVKVRRRKGEWFASIDPWAVPAGGTHQGTVRIVGPGGTQHLPVRVQMHVEGASPFLKLGFFFLTATSLIPAAGLLCFLIALMVYWSNSRDVRAQVSSFMRTACMIAAANALFSTLAWWAVFRHGL